MKKLLTLLLVLIAFISNAQDITPLPSATIKKLIAPNSPTFYYNTIDSAFWVFKGETGWLRIATNSQLQKYYVPYSGAIKDLNLNTHSILAEGQQLPLFNGACQIPTFTDNGNGTVTIGSGDYHLSTLISGKGSKKCTLVGGTFTMTDLASNYIVVDYNNGSPYIHVITDVALINETTIVPIYTVFRNGTYLHTQNWDALGLALANKIHQSIVKTQRYRKEPGGLGLTAVANRTFSITAGTIWTGAVPNILSEINTAADNLFFYYHSTGAWTVSVQPNYNYLYYDDGVNLVALQNSKYAVNWVFRGVESQKHIYIVAGSGAYTLEQAEKSPLPPIPIQISSHAILLYKVIVLQGATNPTSIYNLLEKEYIMGSVQSHGDLTNRDTADSHPAGAIANTPYSTISAISVQGAINELTDEKENLSNKENVTVDNSTTKYPTVNLLKTYADTKDPSPTNELNTSVIFNKTNNKIEITDAGGTKSDTIDINTAILTNEFRGTIAVVSQTVSFSWPIQFASSDYYLDLYPYYTETIDGKSVEIKNAIYDKTQSATGFSFKVDTIAGFVKYRASRILQSETPANVVLKSDIVTVVGTPGSDDKIPSEKAVRASLSGFAPASNYFKGGSRSSNGNLNNYTSVGASFYVSSDLNTPTGDYGTLFNIDGYGDGGGSGWNHQLAFDTSGEMFFRESINNNINWANWKRFWHSGNSNLLTVDWNAKNINAINYMLNGNNLFSGLTANYLPYWDGTKFVNTLFSQTANQLSYLGNSNNTPFKTQIDGASFWEFGQNAGALSNNNTFGFYNSIYGANNGVRPVIQFDTSGNIKINSLESTKTRLLSVSSIGTITAIPDATVAGQVLQSDANGNYSWVNQSGGSSFSGASIYGSTQTINTSGGTIAWDVEYFDTDNYHSALGTTLTAPSDGYYEVCLSLNVNISGDVTSYTVRIVDSNLSAYIVANRFQDENWFSGNKDYIYASKIIYLTTGGSVRAQIIPVGASVAISSSVGASIFQIKKL